MRKKDQLYTVNKWNQPLFMPQENLFWDGGRPDYSVYAEAARADQEAHPEKYVEGVDLAKQYAQQSKNAFGISKANNPFSKANIKGTIGSVAPAVAGAVGGLANSAISGGLSSAAGSAISGIGSTVGGAIGAVNPVAGAIVTAGSQLIGGLTNAAFGSKMNDANIQKVKGAISNMSSSSRKLLGASNNDELINQWGSVDLGKDFSDSYIGKDGWFSNKARREAERLRNQQNAARAIAKQAMATGAENIDSANDMQAAGNFIYANGGPLEMIGNDMGAIGYGFMSDYLDAKNRQNRVKDTTSNFFAGVSPTFFAEGGGIEIKHPGRLTALKKRTGKTEAELWAEGKPDVRKMITFARNARKWKKAYGGLLDAADNFFALGGDIQNHGADWSTGLTKIDAGDSHEMNPYEGVQIGVDQNGTPNLVEEGETIFNDYVYSNRIEADDETKRAFHISKNRKISYADISKKLEKEAAERPNDPISKAALRKQLSDLADHQERQKTEMEAEKAQEAFASMSPEEQTALMQNVAMSQQAPPQEAAQPSPEEMAMMQEQAAQEQMMVPQEGTAESYACGGNLFAPGGNLNDMIRWLASQHPEIPESRRQSVAQRMVGVYGEHYKKRPAFVKLHDVYNEATSKTIRKNNSVGASSYNSSPNTPVRSNKQAAVAPINRQSDVITDPRVATANIIRNNNRQRELRRQRESMRGVTPLQADFTQPVWGSNGFNGEAAPTFMGSYTPARSTASTPQNGSTQTATSAINTTTAGSSAIRQAASTPQAPMTGNGIVGQTAPATYAAASTPATNSNGWNPYAWYRNGLAGYNPQGFTVGDNGLVTDYTDAYRDLVERLTAEDIRAWAEANPNDPSLRSFLERGNSLDDLTTNQWRRGALDGKFGFMHHVADSMLKNPPAAVPAEGVATTTEGGTPTPTGGDNITTPAGGVSPREYHILEGADANLPQNPALWDYTTPDLSTMGAEVRRVTRPDGNTIIYHSPATTTEASGSATETSGTDTATDATKRRVVPVHRNEALRYAGLFGPAVGLGMQALGIGKPDYSGLDAALQIASNGDVGQADYQPIGNYLTYRPMDIWYNQNRMDANSRATDRAILNSSMPHGSRMAGLLASSYNSQLGSSELYRQALDYNDKQRQVVEDFNKGTDQFNAAAYNQAALANAQMRSRNKQFNAQLAMEAAAQKMNADAAWNQGIYGNVSGLFKGLGDLGRENAQKNMIASMAASGLFGNINPDTFIANDYLRYETDEERNKRLRGKGGKTNRRKGLTF